VHSQESQSGTHVLVTGAGGYIGRHVVTALLDQGARVTAVVRPSSRREVDARAHLVEADVLDPALDLSSLAQEPPEAVVHLAWQDGFAHNAPSHMGMLSRHYALLRALSEWGATRIAVLGTMHEIGYWEGPISAGTPAQPLSLYGIAKNALRQAVFADPGISTVQWLRCYYIYGDDRNNRSIFTRLLEAVDRGEPALPFTTGRNLYDFIRVEELGRQIAAVVLRPGVEGIVECCSGEPVSLAQKVEEFIAENALPIRLEYGAFPDRPYDSPGVWGDATRIREILATE